MPQSFAIDNKAKETGGNLADSTAALKALLEIIDLQKQTILLLTAINVQLGKMGPDYTDPEEVRDQVPFPS